MMNKEDEPLTVVRYKVIGATTEELTAPVYSLLQLPEKSTGWSSVRFCSYPQEILIQFIEPVRLCQVNLLLHNKFISSRIDLYHFFPKSYNDFFADYNMLTYDKLGYIIPDTNSRTEYKARELKKVFLNDNCLYLKLVFHKNYSNIHNYFNQVGLFNIECFGHSFTSQNVAYLFPGKPQYPHDLDLYVPSPQDDLLLDEGSQVKILELQEKLKAATSAEDYDKAKDIHGYIKRIRLLGGKILNLQQIKQKAIETNDYDTAKVMKCEIDRIKGMIKEIELNEHIVPQFYSEGMMKLGNELYGQLDNQQGSEEIDSDNKYEQIDADKIKSQSKLLQEQKKQKDMLAQQSSIESRQNFKKKKDDGRRNFQEDDDGILEYAEEA